MAEIRKTKLPKNKRHLIVIILILIVLLTVFTFISRGKETGVELSCKTGDFVKMTLPRTPPMCIGCVEPCTGIVSAYVNKNLICTGKRIETSAVSPPSSVFVPCNNLKSYFGKEVSIESTVNSSYGYFEKKWSGVIGGG